jgi:hypothetical protein
MARKIRSSPLEARTARLRLPVSRKPLFVRITDGVNLGYRRNPTAGTWICRLADGKGGMRTKAVGTADDYDESDGATILTFWQAQDRAKAVAAAGFDAPLPPSESPAPAIETATTLHIALSSYEADLKTRGGDASNAVRVRRHLTDAMLDRPVVDLSLSDLRT